MDIDKLILQKEIEDCKKCKLGKGFKSFGWGDKDSSIIFIGSNPTQRIKENRLCFQSNTIKPLFRALLELGYKSKDFYFTNKVKCPTPKNRVPMKKETTLCESFLQHELDVVKPKIIICLGKYTSVEYGIPKMYTGIYIGEHSEVKVYLFPHPSYINRFPKNYEKFKKCLGVILNNAKI